MKKITWLALLLACLTPLKPLFAQDRAVWMADKTGASISLNITDESIGIRHLTASKDSLWPLSAKLRFTTMIVLPETEEIMEAATGDVTFWPIDYNKNVLHIHPAKAGAETNLNLVTTSGSVYSFLLKENSKAIPDLKVYVSADPTQAAPKQRYIAVEQYDAVQSELLAAHAAMDAERQKTDEKIEAFKKAFPTQLHFDYSFASNTKPFYIKAIWHNSRMTFLQTDAKELPAIYEVKDGKGSIINFNVEGGLYIIPKVLDDGYLAIGKEKLPFKMYATAKSND